MTSIFTITYYTQSINPHIVAYILSGKTWLLIFPRMQITGVEIKTITILSEFVFRAFCDYPRCLCFRP